MEQSQHSHARDEKELSWTAAPSGRHSYIHDARRSPDAEGEVIHNLRNYNLPNCETSVTSAQASMVHSPTYFKLLETLQNQ
jgi:hypothetical protein